MVNSTSQVNSLHKGPVTRKMFAFDDVIMPSKCKKDFLNISLYKHRIINTLLIFKEHINIQLLKMCI